MFILFIPFSFENSFATLALKEFTFYFLQASYNKN